MNVTSHKRIWKKRKFHPFFFFFLYRLCASSHLLLYIYNHRISPFFCVSQLYKYILVHSRRSRTVVKFYYDKLADVDKSLKWYSRYVSRFFPFLSINTKPRQRIIPFKSTHTNLSRGKKNLQTMVIGLEVAAW